MRDIFLAEIESLRFDEARFGISAETPREGGEEACEWNRGSFFPEISGNQWGRGCRDVDDKEETRMIWEVAT